MENILEEADMLVCFDPYVGTAWEFPKEEIIKMAGEAGYEGINLQANGSFFKDNKISDLEKIEELLGKYKLKVPTIAFGYYDASLPQKKAETIEHFHFVLKIARRLGTKIIAIWPGMPKDVFVEDALETLTENLETMLKESKEDGISYALEFEKNSPLDNYIQALAFLENKLDLIGLTCDTYHMNNFKADQYKSIKKMKKKVIDVHISGSHRHEPGTEGDVIDYDKLMKGLVETGYKGPLTAQYHLLGDVTSIPRACKFIKNLRDKHCKGA